MAEDTTNHSNKPENIQKPAAKSRSGLFITIIILLILVLSVVVYLTFQRGEEIEQKDTELLMAYEQLDSIGDEMTLKISQIEELGGDVEELTKIKQELETEKEELLKNKQYSNKQIKDLRERLEGYKELLIAKDDEISKLEQINEQLVEENTELKVERNQLNETIKEAEKVQETLTNKVKVASRLEAENIGVYALSGKGKEREGEFRARQIEQLKVDFTIAKNDVAPIEGKEIYIQILDENDNPIFDVAKGSGTFTHNGEETFYTLKQEILFDNSEQQVSFVYDKETEYEAGVYKVQIITDGYSMGSKTFRVK